MLVGFLGSIPFRVSRENVLTFDEFSRSAAGRWTEHNIIGSKPLPEFLGASAETITFKIQMRADLGASPETLLMELRKLRDDGTPVPLIINNKLINSNYWTVQSISEVVNHWGKGYILSATASLTLKEYVK